jgi:hypothetical protein
MDMGGFLLMTMTTEQEGRSSGGEWIRELAMPCLPRWMDLTLTLALDLALKLFMYIAISFIPVSFLFRVTWCMDCKDFDLMT